MISKIIRCAFQVLTTQEQTSRLATKRKIAKKIAFDNSPVYHSPFSQISARNPRCAVQVKVLMTQKQISRLATKRKIAKK